MRIPLRGRGVTFGWFWGFCYVFMVLGGVNVGHEIFFFFFFLRIKRGRGVCVGWLKLGFSSFGRMAPGKEYGSCWAELVG